MVHHVYRGRYDPRSKVLFVSCDGDYFGHEPSLKVANHSPTGFSWGYGGSGPAQLALALLLEVCDDDLALELHQAFKWDVVARFAPDGWQLTTRQIRCWVMHQLTGVDEKEISFRE
jgi:Family of unknown function (DUF6166)